MSVICMYENYSPHYTVLSLLSFQNTYKTMYLWKWEVLCLFRGPLSKEMRIYNKERARARFFLNSNSFSFPWSGLSLNSSFDSVNQPEPRVSSPVQAHLQVSLPPENGSSVRTNFENILPGQVIPENPPSIERMNKKIESLSGKIDTVLLNQQIIID